MKKLPDSDRIEVVSTALYAGRKHALVQSAGDYFRTNPVNTLVEPFAGSGVVGLSLLNAGICEKLVLIEQDERIVKMLRGICYDLTLAEQYAKFDPTRENVKKLLSSDDDSAFRYLVQSRCCNRGKFSGGPRAIVGERWCAATVVPNLRLAYALRDRIAVLHGDALELVPKFNRPNVGVFADPSYLGERLNVYEHNVLDHKKLFTILHSWRGPFLLTHCEAPETHHLASWYGFQVMPRIVTTAHNAYSTELVLWKTKQKHIEGEYMDERTEEIKAALQYQEHWLTEDEATILFEHLFETAPWQTDKLYMFGSVKTPLRKRVVYGVRYDYNPLAPESHDWTRELFDIRMRLQEFTGLKFNSCVANLYENGHAYIGWHHDKHNPEMIASISLGAVRWFGYADARGNVLHHLEPGHGSLLLTPREINNKYKHGLTMDYECTQPRINLTYRFLPETQTL